MKGKLPKQAAALLSGKAKVTTYETTGGKTISAFAAHNLALIPGGTKPGSTVHDNACGSGIVSRHILLQNASPSDNDITIYATDMDQTFLDKSENTNFSDGFFDYDMMNMAIIFMSSTGLDATREMYRTLKPGGFAVVNCWKAITWLLPIVLVHKAFRGGGGGEAKAPPVSWTDGKQLKEVLMQAGFEEGKMRMESHEVRTVVEDGDELRAWAEKTWAYLGGVFGDWCDGDEEKWDEEVDMLAGLLKTQPGSKVEGGKVTMTASQWVAVAEK
ncbi:S-adenosyl-L-methionine-dependent methyltransferase [Rhypophila decipiens]|uniref:S-adenosyl-L-methionine-dependent methyltransferase n=1 Tax=Rhypophila decipiens TaxID=261697 RepID=A0AAN7AZA7_9PEZI|nr:S-adenosyl-L-methionine-dependent methyltransferase [Rhypophila decipiens]